MSLSSASRIANLIGDESRIEEILQENPSLTKEEVLSVLKSAARILDGESSPQPQDPLFVYIDGACRGNPGPGGAGVVIYKGDIVIGKASRSLGKVTNNIAEYEAVILGLKKAMEVGAKKVVLFTDSKLLVNQMNGRWCIKDKALVRLSLEVDRIRKGFEEVSFNYIPRNKNKEANLLAIQATYH
jgi:ribonuclease HI